MVIDGDDSVKEANQADSSTQSLCLFPVAVDLLQKVCGMNYVSFFVKRFSPMHQRVTR